MKWLASPPNPSSEFWQKLMDGFPSSWSETHWADWAWLVLFLYLGSPLMVQMWGKKNKGRKQVFGLLALAGLFVAGWAFVGYFVR